MRSTSRQASLENFKIKSRLQFQYTYFSAEALFDTLNHQQEANRIYWLEDALPEIPQGLLLLNYATEFSNPKDRESGKKQNQKVYPSSPPQKPPKFK